MTSPPFAPLLLTTRIVDKVWGQDHLPPPFVTPPGEWIDEIWFEPPPELPQALVKYLFASEKLSVQVHPFAAQALLGKAGKEECWLILDAEPEARLAIGLDVWSRALMVYYSPRNGRMHYGPGFARERPHDSGSPSSNTR